MIDSVFVTGGTGFVGRRLLRALELDRATDVRLLVRQSDSLPSGVPSSWRCVPGSLATPDCWCGALKGVDTVLHLASTTGKSPRHVHRRVILDGTRQLLACAQEAGVRRFLFVSSIAAGFANRRGYHYGEAKRLAEEAVRASPLDTLILRPTMILGPGSPLLDALRRLARLPMPLMFGSGSIPVQPIHVDDVVAILMATVVTTAPWDGQTLALGGPDTLTTEELLRLLRDGDRRDTGPFLHVPIEPLRTVLAVLEPLLLPLLPFTAGQLATFANAGTAGPPGATLLALLRTLPRPLRTMDDMIASPRPRAD